MLTLFGAMLAGVLTDSMLAKSAGRDQEEEGDSDEEAEIGPASSAELGGTTPLDLLQGPDLLQSYALPATPVTLTSSDADDLLSGGKDGEQIGGATGADQIDCKAGDEDLIGGSGDDVIWAEVGQDPLDAGGGDDILHGQVGQDLFAGDDDDPLSGHLGGDQPDRGAGNPSLYTAFSEGEDGKADDLYGGQRDDLLLLGAGDHVDADEDQFILSEWLDEGGFTTITDYDSAEDQIVLVYDPAWHADPQLSVSAVADTQDVEILLDGEAIGRISGGAGLSAKDILLLPA